MHLEIRVPKKALKITMNVSASGPLKMPWVSKVLLVDNLLSQWPAYKLLGGHVYTLED